MNRENKIAVSLSAIWVAWVYIPLILCVARLEYPKMTDSVFGIVFMLILCVPSVVCLIYSFFCKFEYKKVLYKIIYAFFAIFLFLIRCLHLSMFFALRTSMCFMM